MWIQQTPSNLIGRAYGGWGMMMFQDDDQIGNERQLSIFSKDEVFKNILILIT